MILANIAFIVDGLTEKQSLNTKLEMRYHKLPVIRTGPGNGVDVLPEGYAKRVIPTILSLMSTCVRAIILIPDLEKRNLTCEEFRENIKQAIIHEILAKEHPTTQSYLDNLLFVCPPNTMFENWIISDVEGIKREKTLIKEEAVQEEFEGQNGCVALRRIMVTHYKKSIHGSLLFKKTRDDISCQNSESFQYFFNILTECINKHCQETDSATDSCDFQ